MAKRMPRVSGNDALMDAVKAVHAAGIEAQLWPDALKSVSRVFGAVGATFEIFDKRAMALRNFHAVGLPNGAELPYVEYFSRHNPRANYAMRHLSEKILYDYRFIDERAMNRDAYYSEYLQSIDLRYFLTGQIVDTPDIHGVVSVQRSRKQGHIGKHELEWMRRLLPHLCQAYEMSDRLQNAAAAGRSLERALDWLSDGVALILADGSVLYANEVLAAFARRNDGIAILRGLLEFESAEARAQFSFALAAVQRTRTETLAAGFPDFAAPRRGGAPSYVVSVRPLALSERSGAAQAAHAIVFVRDPLACGVAAAAILRALFGFTEAEANLAQALQSGQSLTDYAQTRRLSLNTVYTHLRRIKEKTHTKRQAELIHKLNSVRSPARDE